MVESIAVYNNERINFVGKCLSASGFVCLHGSVDAPVVMIVKAAKACRIMRRLFAKKPAAEQPAGVVKAGPAANVSMRQQ